MNFMKKSVKFILDNGFCNLVQTIKREKADLQKYQQKGETFWEMVYFSCTYSYFVHKLFI